jgi:peptidoglycan/xylan/chitin deacetylase (PgdA/CDA1 family)
MKLASVNIDLDEIPNYFAIHGLEAKGEGATAVYDVAVKRLRDFADALGIPLTFFAVGSDLARPEATAALRAAVADGHEIANHTLDHKYDLTRLPRAEMAAQVRGGADAIERAVGRRPRGFRAPGYTIHDELFEVLVEEGVTYDSSVFPCPAYYAAKTAAIGLIAARGRTSQSVVDKPTVLAAPTRPYRVGKPYWRKGGGLLEVPIQVTRGLRLPYIGTSLRLGGPLMARGLTAMCVGEPLVNLELHGIDVLDASDGLEALRPYQPDVRVPVATKLEALRACVTMLRSKGYSFVTLEQGAERFAA